MKKVTSYKLQVTRKCKHSKLATCHLPLATHSGYTLLFAMIVASIVLALGVSLLTVSRKEFILSSSATQSTNAFYAADSAANCAEYWDHQNNEFSTSTSNLNGQGPGNFATNPIACSLDMQTHKVAFTNAPTNVLSPTPISTVWEFSFSTPFSTDGTNNKSCAYVTVDKYYASVVIPGYNNNNPLPLPFTVINSRGYNIGWNPAGNGDCSLSSPKKLERAVQVIYN